MEEITLENIRDTILNKLNDINLVSKIVWNINGEELYIDIVYNNNITFTVEVCDHNNKIIDICCYINNE